MASYYKFPKPKSGKLPKGLSRGMFVFAPFVLIRESGSKIECSFLHYQDEEEDCNEIWTVEIDEVPKKAKKVTKKYYESLVEV